MTANPAVLSRGSSQGFRPSLLMRAHPIPDIDGQRTTPDNNAMTEHTFMAALLIFGLVQVAFVGYLVYRVVRKSDHLEGMIAATYLQARKFLEQQSR